MLQRSVNSLKRYASNTRDREPLILAYDTWSISYAAVGHGQRFLLRDAKSMKKQRTSKRKPEKYSFEMGEEMEKKSNG